MGKSTARLVRKHVAGRSGLPLKRGTHQASCTQTLAEPTAALGYSIPEAKHVFCCWFSETCPRETTLSLASLSFLPSLSLPSAIYWVSLETGSGGRGARLGSRSRHIYDFIMWGTSSRSSFGASFPQIWLLRVSGGRRRGGGDRPPWLRRPKQEKGGGGSQVEHVGHASPL